MRQQNAVESDSIHSQDEDVAQLAALVNEQQRPLAKLTAIFNQLTKSQAPIHSDSKHNGQGLLFLLQL